MKNEEKLYKFTACRACIHSKLSRQEEAPYFAAIVPERIVEEERTRRKESR